MQKYLHFSVKGAKVTWGGSAMQAKIHSFATSLKRSVVFVLSVNICIRKRMSLFSSGWREKGRYISVCSCSSQGQNIQNRKPMSAIVTSVLTFTVERANNHSRRLRESHMIRTRRGRTLSFVSILLYSSHITGYLENVYLWLCTFGVRKDLQQ